jgi:predicted translin family RNA/ssDNA-binding protein
LQLTEEEYLLGLADCGGELMRFAINSIGRGDMQAARQVARVLRQWQSTLDLLVSGVWSLHYLAKKLSTLNDCCRKVEDALCSIALTAAESALLSKHYPSVQPPPPAGLPASLADDFE